MDFFTKNRKKCLLNCSHNTNGKEFFNEESVYCGNGSKDTFLVKKSIYKLNKCDVVLTQCMIRLKALIQITRPWFVKNESFERFPQYQWKRIFYLYTNIVKSYQITQRSMEWLSKKLLRSQIKLLTCEKAGSYEKAGHVFFIVQFFLGSNFL